MFLSIALALALGYSLGGLPFGYWISRFYGIADIRQHGSGNTGATNVWRIAGKSAGLIALFLDVLKGIMSVVLVSYLPEVSESNVIAEISAGGAAIVGHVFSPWLNFRGGKGVITSLGVFLALLPFEALGALSVFVITVSVSRYVSLGSMAGGGAMLLILLAETAFFSDSAAPHPAYLFLSAAFAGIIIYKHRGNISRIRDGTERRFSMSRSKDNQTH